MAKQITLGLTATQWTEVVKTFEDEATAITYIDDIMKDRVHQTRIANEEATAAAAELTKLATEGF